MNISADDIPEDAEPVFLVSTTLPVQPNLVVDGPNSAPIETVGPAEGRRTLRHIVVVFAAMAIANAANFIYHFGSVRLLGLNAYSVLAALLALVLIFGIPATVVQAIVASVFGELSAGGNERTRGLSRVVTNVALCASAGIALVGILLAPAVARYLTIPDFVATYLMLLAIAFAFSVAALRGILQGQERFGNLAISLIVEGCGNLGFGLAFIVILGGVRGAILGNVCGTFAALLLSLAAVWKTRSRGKPSIDLRRLATKFVGTTFALGALAAMSLGDVVLVRHVAPTTLAGAYGPLSIVGKVVLFSVAFAPLVLLAKVAKSKAEGRPTRPLLVSIACVGLTICLVELFMIKIMPVRILAAVAGPNAVSAAPYLFGYASAMTFLALTTIVANYAIGAHRFLFVLPLMLLELGEVVGISFRHSNLADVITVIIIGHGSALFVTTAIVMAGRNFAFGSLSWRKGHTAS